MVMGRDSRSEGRGFESWHSILDGIFSTYICCKNCNVYLKRPKINIKEAGVGPFKKRIEPYKHYLQHWAEGGSLAISLMMVH